MQTKIVLIILVCLGLVSCSKTYKKQKNTERASQARVESANKTANTIPTYVQMLISAYPAFNLKYENNYLIFQDGTRIVCNDEKEKSFIEKLDNCDIEDMFSMTYNTNNSTPAYLDDCGRGRCEELFKKMYGKNESEVKRNLRIVNWFDQKLLFTEINGAAEQLEKVAADLRKMPQMRKYLTNSSSFYWRKVRGANRQSAHSYGIAIDINTSFSNYWLWANPRSTETDKLNYENRIPIEIVKVFEKHGFIWGGRWYHYDTMHFEYRPEFFTAK